jgi:hypothetical protein
MVSFCLMKYALKRKSTLFSLQTFTISNLLACFISRPADRSTGHRCHNSWLDSLEEALEALSSIKQPRSFHESIHISQLGICSRSSCLQHRLNYVHWSSECRSKATCNSTSSTMCYWIIHLRGIHSSGNRLVCKKLQCREWNCHRQCRGVRNIECGEALMFVNVLRAVGHRFVHFLRVVNLHSLLDDCSILADSFPNF